jgi:quinol monooxygenase YgiN
VTVSFVLHRVADYDAWRRVYDRVPDVQRERGVTGQAVYRAEGDPNNLLVMQEFRSSQEAHSFFENPQFREVMQDAGVDVGSMRFEFYDPA